VSGDKARGDWTSWPVAPGQLEIRWPDSEDWPAPVASGNGDHGAPIPEDESP
jgi:hypothetical protein